MGTIVPTDEKETPAGEFAPLPPPPNGSHRAAWLWVPSVLRIVVLFCFLLPFLTLDASCGEFKTGKITGAQLLAGDRPVVHSEPASGTAAMMEELDQPDAFAAITDKFDTARAWAIAACLLTVLGLAMMLRPLRGASRVSIALGALTLVALVGIASRGSPQVGLYLAFGLSFVALCVTAAGRRVESPSAGQLALARTLIEQGEFEAGLDRLANAREIAQTRRDTEASTDVAHLAQTVWLRAPAGSVSTERASEMMRGLPIPGPKRV